MTRSAHDEAVEAAADVLVYEDSMPRPTGHHFAALAITAYLRHMRAAGFVVTRVPALKDPATTLYVSNDALAQEADHAQVRRRMVADANWAAGKVEGFNEAIAATLANAVEVPE